MNIIEAIKDYIAYLDKEIEYRQAKYDEAQKGDNINIKLFCDENLRSAKASKMQLQTILDLASE